jgi:hypothetical protein
MMTDDGAGLEAFAEPVVSLRMAGPREGSS